MASSNVSWGIDIGAGAIKALRLERDGDNVRVADFVVVPHKRVLSTPDVVESDAIRVALGSFLGEYREQLRGVPVTCSLPGHATFSRFAKLPPVERKGVENLVKFEAVQQIPYDIEEVEWDYQVFASDDSPEVEVGIFAVTRERVEEKLSLWGEAGLAPDEITLGPVAAYNAIAYDLAFTEDSPGTVIVDVGTVATDLIIAERGRVWIRTFPIGGHHFTEVLAETFKLDYRKAETLKREAETSKYKRHIFQALKPILSDLVEDVKRSINYYTETHEEAKLERVIGLGSTFKLLGLRKLMSQQLGMEVYRIESFKRATVEGSAAVEFDTVSLNMASAYGLALQGLEMTPIGVNLVPTGVTRESLWRAKTPYFVAAALIGIVGAGATFIKPVMDGAHVTDFSGGQVRQFTNRMSTLKGEWESIRNANVLDYQPANAWALDEPRDQTELLRLLTDVQSMLAQAQSADDEPLYRLFSFNSDYLPPSTAFAAAESPSASGGRSGGSPFGGRNPGRDADSDRDDRGDGGGGMDAGQAGGDQAAVSETQAGTLGAFRVTVQLDSTSGDLPVFNDEILEWLRSEESLPADRAYVIVGVPTVESVELVSDLTPEARLGGNPFAQQEGSGTRPGGSRMRGGGGGGGGGAAPNFGRDPNAAGGAPAGGRNPDSAPRMPNGGSRVPDAGVGRATPRPEAPRPTPRGGNNTAPAGGDPSLAEPDFFDGEETLYRYTVTYFVQRLAEPPARGDEAPSDAEPASDQASAL